MRNTVSSSAGVGAFGLVVDEATSAHSNLASDRHAHWPRFSATSYVIRGRRRRRFFAQHLYG